MSSHRNFRNPTHGSEVVNATRFGPASPRASWAKKCPKNSQKIPPDSPLKSRKIRQKNYFSENFSENSSNGSVSKLKKLSKKFVKWKCVKVKKIVKKIRQMEVCQRNPEKFKKIQENSRK
jgi:hypothetical protein